MRIQYRTQYAPIDDIELMQVLERTKKLGGVVSTSLLVKLSLSLQMIEQLSSVH
jgi:hypothetical protein